VVGENGEVNLTLRKLVETDATILAEWQTDALFCAHAGWRPSESRQHAASWWQNQISHPDPQLVRLLALDSFTPIGYADQYGSGQAERELGFLIAPFASWDRGLGRAAARAGVEFGFEALGLSRIWAEAVEANTASVKVLRRLGMREIGIGAEEDSVGQKSQYVQFEISAAEWREPVRPIAE
jgi:RimJ/RimL family protein N-acetyltransferase